MHESHLTQPAEWMFLWRTERPTFDFSITARNDELDEATDLHPDQEP